VNGDGLRVDGVTVRFGGRVAVNCVSLYAPMARLTGLIGPNGAGKTTIFNACSGFVHLDAGAVHLGDHDLTRLGAAERAGVGLGRTFQRMELYNSLTVAENVALGPEAALAGRRAWSQLWATSAERREVAERASEAMERCGITYLAGRGAGELPTGQRRLVELARAIASRFRFLLLDEPSSGLDSSETSGVAEILRGVVESGVGILLVEHDMGLVREICEYTYVLDFGELIFEGTMDEVLASDIVRAAYLGSEAA
jgi:ABC-type branched-subunit amino acid transport system ATPase component